MCYVHVPAPQGECDYCVFQTGDDKKQKLGHKQQTNKQEHYHSTNIKIMMI